MFPGQYLRVLVVSGVVLAGPAMAADDPCGAEMDEMQDKSIAEIRRHNFHSNASSNKKAEKRLIAWLKKRHAEVERHEEAHEAAAGKWAGKTEYLYYEWRGKKYAIAGCHMPKKGIPLERKIKAALAPKSPSDTDKTVAAQAKAHIEIKAARRNCRKLKSRAKQQKCLKQYSQYRWLDKYPLR